QQRAHLRLMGVYRNAYLVYAVLDQRLVGAQRQRAVRREAQALDAPLSGKAQHARQIAHQRRLASREMQVADGSAFQRGQQRAESLVGEADGLLRKDAQFFRAAGDGLAVGAVQITAVGQEDRDTVQRRAAVYRFGVFQVGPDVLDARFLHILEEQ